MTRYGTTTVVPYLSMTYIAVSSTADAVLLIAMTAACLQQHLTAYVAVATYTVICYWYMQLPVYDSSQ